KIFNQVSWNDYDVLILPQGNYGEIFTEDNFKILEDWIDKGGKLIAMGNAVNVFDGKEGFDLERNDEKEKDEANNNGDAEHNLKPYADREMDSTKDMITGSIYKVTLDNTHPLAFG